MELFQNRKDEEYLAKLVKNDDILKNDCNLSVSSYVEQEDTREVINIKEVNTKLSSLIIEGNKLNQKLEFGFCHLEPRAWSDTFLSGCTRRCWLLPDPASCPGCQFMRLGGLLMASGRLALGPTPSASRKEGISLPLNPQTLVSCPPSHKL